MENKQNMEASSFRDRQGGKCALWWNLKASVLKPYLHYRLKQFFVLFTTLKKGLYLRNNKYELMKFVCELFVEQNITTSKQ